MCFVCALNGTPRSAKIKSRHRVDHCRIDWYFVRCLPSNCKRCPGLCAANFTFHAEVHVEFSLERFVVAVLLLIAAAHKRTHPHHPAMAWLEFVIFMHVFALRLSAARRMIHFISARVLRPRTDFSYFRLRPHRIAIHINYAVQCTVRVVRVPYSATFEIISRLGIELHIAHASLHL